MKNRLMIVLWAVALSACEQAEVPAGVDAAREPSDGAPPSVDGAPPQADMDVEPDMGRDDTGPGTVPDAWQGSGCPDMTRLPLSECVRAAVVADCGGEGAPRLFCRAVDELASPECLWFDGGCPALEFSRRCDVASAPDCYPGRFGGFGAAPWTLERATTIDTAVNPALGDMRDVTVDCGPCGIIPGAAAPDGWEEGRCLRREGLCGELLEPLRLQRSSAEWPWSSWVSWMIVHPSLGGGAALLIEFDPRAEGGHARACIVWQSDAGITEDPPICATNGELEVDHWPVSREDAATVKGRLVADFPPLSPYPSVEPFIDGLHIEARF